MYSHLYATYVTLLDYTSGNTGTFYSALYPHVNHIPLSN